MNIDPDMTDDELREFVSMMPAAFAMRLFAEMYKQLASLVSGRNRVVTVPRLFGPN